MKFFMLLYENCRAARIPSLPTSSLRHRVFILTFFFLASLDSSFSLVRLYSPTKEYLLYLVRECSHERIINALCLSGCPCIPVVIGDTGSYFLSLSLPRKKMKCLVALFSNNNKISRILSYRREPVFPLVLC